MTALTRARTLMAEAETQNRNGHGATASISAQLALGHAMVAAAEAIAQLTRYLADHEEPAA